MFKHKSSFKVDDSEDISGCPALEGMMKKKNSHGVWKDRYGLLKNAYFLTYKPKGNKPTSELKESVNLKDVDEVALKADTLQICMKNGEVMTFGANNIKDWSYAIDVRVNWAAEQDHKPQAKASSAGTGSSLISGWLMKKSHNKYQGFQDRFVKVDGHHLRYYKREQDTEESGSADLASVSSIRAYDDTADCRVFEVSEPGRTFIFQAPSTKEMNHWISVLEGLRQSIETSREEAAKAKDIAATPAIIRSFDDMGEEAFHAAVSSDVAEMYPDESMTIRQHIECASGLISFLQDIVPEVQRAGSRPARYDVLACVMTIVHDRLGERFASFLSTEAEAEESAERSALLEQASLGDLHALIDWLTRYQQTLRGIRCPTQQTGNSAGKDKLSGTFLTPKNCAAFNALTPICKLYVYGGSTGSKGGASAHLYDHCIKVWNSVVNRPEEMLQRNNDGSFYTHAPVDMWEAINQHISLAIATRSPILHVMIADKIVSSLNAVFNIIITYVQQFDGEEVKEIALEYFSALANDTALHIEEVIELIENFTIPEIRDRIDEIFDPLTNNLINCGQACLKRLASLVMSDVSALLDAVFTEEWLEGNQMHVATATISDYMNDFEEYLVAFWADKFIHTILEEVILTYTRSVIFKKKRTSSAPPAPILSQSPQAQAPPVKTGFMSSMFSKTKAILSKPPPSVVPMLSAPVLPHVPVDSESIGRLAQDVNILNAFFSKKTSQEVAMEYLGIMNEVSLMMFLDLEGLIKHLAQLISDYPSACNAVLEVTLAVMRMRPQDFDKLETNTLVSTVQPIIDTAPADARDKEAKGIVEGRLGLLFIDVVPKDVLAGKQKMTLAHRLQMMSNIPLFKTNKRVEEEEELDEEPEEDTKDDDALLNDVMEVLNQQEEAEAYEREQREAAQVEEEIARHKIGILNYSGYLEKRSPAHNLWQRRFYKLSTRETGNADKPYHYTLIWFKKEGGAAIKSLELEKVDTLSLVHCTRGLVFIPPPLPKEGLWLQSEIGSGSLAVPVSVLEGDDEKTTASYRAAGSEFFVFTITQTDGKEHILRGSKIDRIIKWINLLAQAGGLAYDAKTKMWCRSVLDYYQQQAAERAAQPSFFNVSASALPPSAPPASPTHAVPPAPASSPHIDSESAAALIQASKTMLSSNSHSEEDDKEQERLQKEEKLRREKELLRKKLQEEQQLEMAKEAAAKDSSNANPILAQRSLSAANAIAGGISTANPLLRARERNNSSSENTVVPVHVPEPVAVEAKEDDHPPAPAASPKPEAPVAAAKSTYVSPAMRRAHRLKAKAAAAAAPVEVAEEHPDEG